MQIVLLVLLVAVVSEAYPRLLVIDDGELEGSKFDIQIILLTIIIKNFQISIYRFLSQ